MHKWMKITLLILFITVLLLLVSLFLLLRFTGGALTNEEKVIIGYDEIKGRFQFNEPKTYNLNGNDGPYIINDTVYYVSKNNKLIKTLLINRETIRVDVNNKENDFFYVSLHNKYNIPENTYSLPQKLIAISDIEGNFDAFSGFLIKNKVIDKNFDWIFGNGHLVLNGDFVDRGENVTAVLWLIYKLEYQAAESGGRVHFITGNHEIMNIQGNTSYANEKYKKIAMEISGTTSLKNSYKNLYSKNSELGKWLRSKNIVEKIDGYLFVHGGLNPEIVKYAVSIENINNILRNNIDLDLYHFPGKDSTANFILGKKGPFWYRGLVNDYKYYEKIKETELNTILEKYNAKSFIIGHTIAEDISSDFNGKVIKIDVKHGKDKFSGKTKGLLIEDDILYNIDGNGSKIRLQK